MKFLPLAFSILVALPGLPVWAGEPLSVQTPAVISPAASIRERFKSECVPVGDMLSKDVRVALEALGMTVLPAATPEQAGSNKFVELSILDAQTQGGGGWTGRKSMLIKVEMRQGGKAMSTILKRSSQGGLLGPLLGTCQLIERVSEQLGEDVARWVVQQVNASPTPSAAAPVSASASDVLR